MSTEPGVKVKSQPRLQGVHFLSQTRVPTEGCPRTEAWPGSPPLAPPTISRLGGPGGPGVEVLGGAPLGPQGLPCSQTGLPRSSGAFAKGWRARTRHLDAEFNSDSFEVVRGQPDMALLSPESALEIFFFFLVAAQGLKVDDSWVTGQLAHREEGGFYAAEGAPWGGFRAPGEQNQLQENECNTDPRSHKPAAPDTTRGFNNGFCAWNPTRAPSSAQSWPGGCTFPRR